MDVVKRHGTLTLYPEWMMVQLDLSPSFCCRLVGSVVESLNFIFYTSAKDECMFYYDRATLVL